MMKRTPSLAGYTMVMLIHMRNTTALLNFFFLRKATSGLHDLVIVNDQ